MSKYSGRTVDVAGGGGHSDAGIVAGDESWSAAFLKKFTHKGSLRLYAVQADADANGISAPSYRTLSDDTPVNNQKKDEGQVNGFAEDGEKNLKGKYRKRKEIDNEKKKAKEQEKAEKEKAKEKEKAEREKAKEEREKLKQEQKQRKKDKYSHASSSSQIVKKKKRKEEKEKERQKKAVPVPVVDVSKDAELEPEMTEVPAPEPEIKETPAPVVETTKDESIVDVPEEEGDGESEVMEVTEVTSQKEEVREEEDTKTDVCETPVNVPVSVLAEEEVKGVEEKETKEIIEEEVTQEEVEEVTIPKMEQEESHDIDEPDTAPPSATFQTPERERSIMSGNTKKVIIIERNDSIIVPREEVVQVQKEVEQEPEEVKVEAVEPEPKEVKVEEVEPEPKEVKVEEVEPKVEEKVEIIEEKDEVEPLYAVVNKKKKTSEEQEEVVNTSFVRPEMMKMELPDDSELEESKENRAHIEVQVEIQKSEDVVEYATVKKDRKTNVTTVDAAPNRNGHATPPPVVRPHSEVIVTEQVARQVEEQRGGSVASRASSSAGVPRAMIQGKSWAGSSKASTEQVLQNANGTAKPNRKPTSKAELIFELGSRGNRPGKLRRPHGIAVTAKGDILVCDSGNHRVQIFGWDCKYKTKWSPDTIRRRIFSRDRFDPGDIAITPDNKHFIVTDFATERIYKVSLETLRAKEFGAPGLKGPWGVAVNSQGYIYVAYCISNCIVCFDERGTFVHKIGQKGVGPGEFGYPCYLTINKRDALIVAEYHNRRVQILNPDGKFMFQIGSSEHFREISGVSVDGDNNVFVADYRCHRILMYGNNGAFKMCIGDTEDRLDRPEGMAMSHEGYLVVSDSGNDNVKIFRHWDVRHLLDAMY
ncbi:uncharacterized protein LOC144444486 [Glandiceps talaboti]